MICDEERVFLCIFTTILTCHGQMYLRNDEIDGGTTARVKDLFIDIWPVQKGSNIMYIRVWLCHMIYILLSLLLS